MRLAHSCTGRTPSWTLAAAAALALCACGKEESPAPASTAKPEPEHSPGSTAVVAAQPAGASVPTEGYLLAGPVEDPVEFEPEVKKAPPGSFPEDPSPKAPSVANLPKADEVMGRPLVIGTKVIPFDEIKKQVCLDSLGVAEIEHQKMRIFIEEEQKRRRAAGATEEQITLSPAEMDVFLKGLEVEVKAEYPEGDVGVKDLIDQFGSANPLERVRQQKLFEKLFVPENPDDFPPIAMAAIMSHEGGDSMIESCREHYKARQAEANPAPKTADDRFFDSILVEQVHNYMREKADVQADPSPGVIYRINGVDVKTDDVWNAIKPLVTTMEVRAAKQWITNVTLLQDALEKAGAWLSDEDAEAAYRAHSDPYKDSIFSMERIALMLKRFPSVERYHTYRRLVDSYQRMIASEITQEKIDELAKERINKIVGQISADVDVILCSAYDFKTNRWKPNGWTDAENRMRDVLRLLVDEQRPWEELLEKYSEFYAAPVGVSERANIDPNRPLKGRFRNIQRNTMLTELGESVYSEFLNGSSITDFVFLKQEVGSYGDPMRGPLGWYMPRLYKRSKPPERLPIDPETLAELKKEDYVLWRMGQFTQELIAKNEVFGLDLPE